MLRRIALVLVVSATTVVLPTVEAHAATHVTGNITTNTTWTSAGSPYFIDRSTVFVSSGVTLTIEPGVVVVFTTGVLNTLIVQGTLKANGSIDHHVLFTSLQDYNGSGGLPGQWQAVKFQGSAVGTLDYVDIRYGGYAGYPWIYGDVMVQNNARVTIVHSTIRWSNTSGLLATSTNPVYLIDSVVANNVHGVSVVGGTYGVVQITRSTIANNRTGVYMNWGGPPSGQSSVMDSDITGNGVDGVRLQVAGSVPRSLYPTGANNNIWGNIGGKQLSLLSPRYDVLGWWDDNFWGLEAIATFCPFATTVPWPFHIYYGYDPGYPQQGPITSTTFSDRSGIFRCAADNLPVEFFSDEMLPNGAPPIPG